MTSRLSASSLDRPAAEDVPGRAGTSPVGEEAAANAIDSLVVIPRSPAPLHAVDFERRRKDDLDQAIDEMFGPTTEDGPGLFDAILLLGGAALLGWAFIPGGNPGALPWGIGGLVLGSVLPARTVVRRLRARTAGRRLRAAARDGHLLDVSHPDVQALAEAYERCLGLAPTSPLAVDISVAAHQAMVEVATLLDGAAPASQQELSYVRRRVEALARLEERLRGEAQTREREADGRAARVQAIEELENETGGSSIGQLGDLEDLLTPPRRARPPRQQSSRRRPAARSAGHADTGSDGTDPRGGPG